MRLDRLSSEPRVFAYSSSIVLFALALAFSYPEGYNLTVCKEFYMMKQIRKSELLIPLILVLFYCAVFLVVNFKYLPYFCDGDIYADMLLAKQIWGKKSLFPSNWIYGNQYSVIATPVLASLCYGITGSMNMAMAAASTLMGAFLIISYVWMVSACGADRSCILVSLLVLLCAPADYGLLYQPQGQLMFTLATYYACYLITVFVVFGCYIRSLEYTSSMSRHFLPSWFLAFFLSFACGMQSLRQTAIMVLPLCLIDIIVFLKNRHSTDLPGKKRLL